MSGASKTLRQASLLDLLNAISSPGLEDGPPPLEAPAFPTIIRSGPALAHANRSARQAKAAGLLTSGTYGPPSIGSSASVALTLSLGNRLRDRLGGLGSTLWRLTWKDMATPAGRRFSLLRASAHPKSDTGLTGWPVPSARDWRSESASDEFNQERWEHTRGKPLSAVSTLAGWPAPTKGNADGSQQANASPTGKREDGSKATVALPAIARLAGWPTPMAGTPAQKGYNEAGNTDSGRKTAALCGAAVAGHGLALPEHWSGPARLTASGELQIGSTAETTGGGQLNPKFYFWLQGFPPEWESSAPQETRFASRKRSRSSKQP